MLNPSFTYSNPGTKRKDPSQSYLLPDIKIQRASRKSNIRKDPKIMKIFRNSKREAFEEDLMKKLLPPDSKLETLKVPGASEKQTSRKTRSLSKEQQFLLMEKMKKKKLERESKAFGKDGITKKSQKKLIINFKKQKSEGVSKKPKPKLSKRVKPSLYLQKLQKNLKRKIVIKVKRGTLNLHNPRHVKIVIGKKSEVIRNRLRLISNLRKRIKAERFKRFSENLNEKYGIGITEVKELLYIFGMFDKRKKGFVLLKKVKKSLESLGPDIEFHALYQTLCKWQNDGKIFLNFENFVELVSNKIDTTESRENYRKIFTILDEESKNFVTQEDLTKIIHKLSLEFTEEDVRKMIIGADLKKSNRIEFEDFYKILVRKTF